MFFISRMTEANAVIMPYGYILLVSAQIGHIFSIICLCAEGKRVQRWFWWLWSQWEAENKNKRVTLLSTPLNVVATPNVLLIQAGYCVMYKRYSLHVPYWVWHITTFNYTLQLHTSHLLSIFHDVCVPVFTAMSSEAFREVGWRLAVHHLFR